MLLKFIIISLLLLCTYLPSVHCLEKDNREDQIDGKFNAALGLSELSKLKQDPKILKETLDMLKDPEILKEVQAMMKDPDFIAEMKKYTENPTFKAAANHAAVEIQALADDPVRLKQLEGQIMN